MFPAIFVLIVGLSLTGYLIELIGSEMGSFDDPNDREASDE